MSDRNRGQENEAWNKIKREKGVKQKERKEERKIELSKRKKKGWNKKRRERNKEAIGIEVKRTRHGIKSKGRKE